MNDKKDITITYDFQNTLGKSRQKPNKLWVGKGGEIYNRSMKSWLQNNKIEMHSTNKEENLFVLKDLLGS